jgi:hypothetical protein
MTKLLVSSTLVAKSGSQLDFLSDDGEVLFSLDLPVGISHARDFFPLLPLGCSLSVGVGVTVINQPGGFGRFRDSLLADSSGANPDYIPAKRSAAELQVNAMFGQMQALNKSLLAREAAIAANASLAAAAAPVPAPAPDPISDLVE